MREKQGSEELLEGSDYNGGTRIQSEDWRDGE